MSEPLKSPKDGSAERAADFLGGYKDPPPPDSGPQHMDPGEPCSNCGDPLRWLSPGDEYGWHCANGRCPGNFATPDSGVEGGPYGTRFVRAADCDCAYDFRSSGFHASGCSSYGIYRVTGPVIPQQWDTTFVRFVAQGIQDSLNAIWRAAQDQSPLGDVDETALEVIRWAGAFDVEEGDDGLIYIARNTGGERRYIATGGTFTEALAAALSALDKGGQNG